MYDQNFYEGGGGGGGKGWWMGMWVAVKDA